MPRPTQPPANAGAALGRRLDNVGRSAAKAPIFRSSQKAAVSGGSIVVGLVAYAIGLNYVQHGWPGVVALLKAKLMNKTSQDGNGTPAQPSQYFRRGAVPTGAAAAVAQPNTSSGPEHPSAPVPSGGTLYA